MKNQLTVAELIEKLQAIEDKSLLIACENTGAELLDLEIDLPDLAKEGEKPVVWLMFQSGSW